MWKNTGKISMLVATIAIAICACISCKQSGQSGNIPPEQEIEGSVIAQVDVLYHFVKDTFQPAVVRGEISPRHLQQFFLKSRLLYKRFEWAAEYFMGSTTMMVNGPPVQEVENAELMDPTLTRGLDPSGFQVMEELLFPQYDTSRKNDLITQLNLLQENCKFYKVYFTGLPLANWRILDATKLEVFRILTLGITGYDNPLTLNSMNESAASLESLKHVLAHYTREEKDTTLIGQITAAIDYLHENPGFDSFNRAEFITRYGNKISSGITALGKQLKLPDIRYNRLLRRQAKTLFDSGAFNVNAFAPGPEYFMTKKKVELGKRLFYDASLSGTGTRSCASCHQPDKAFTDGLTKNMSIHGKVPIDRNTPTLINAALQSNLFYDMRALTLEDQVRDVVQNNEEMGGSLREVAKHLQQDEVYRRLFSEAFPGNKKSIIDTFEIMNAVASYVRSLTALNSRFDQYMRGDTTALNSNEIRGFNLFMGKAKCATCHFMPLFNGITPPKYIVNDAEVIGVPSSLNGTTIDPDLGWYNIIGIASYKHAFKTPTLRNIEQTAPYMHNGVYRTLEEVMDFYNNGGGAGLGFHLDNQTLPEDSLHLTQNDIHDVIAFMKSLNTHIP